jgi:hypothetical protein
MLPERFRFVVRAGGKGPAASSAAASATLEVENAFLHAKGAADLDLRDRRLLDPGRRLSSITPPQAP